MPAHNLTDAQRADIVRRLARNEGKSAIARAVGCSLDAVKYYAGKRTPLIEQIKEKFAPQLAIERAARDAEVEARIEAPILAGLREEEGRTDALVWLASEIAHAIKSDGLYGVGFGGALMFKGAEVVQLRGVMDDIAKERGARKNKVEHSGHLTYEVDGVDLDAI